MALAFVAASSQYLQADGASGLTGMDKSGGVYTVTGWFKTTAAGAAMNLSGATSPSIFERRRQGASTDRMCYVAINTGGVLGFAISQDPTFSAVLSSTTTVNTGDWFHFAVQRNGTTSYKVFINGVEEANGSTSLSSAGNGFHNTIGCRTSDAGARTAFFDGTIEDVRIYLRALSADEIQTICACRGADHRLTNLSGRWYLREAAPGQTASGADFVKDNSTSANHMTPGNSPAYADGVLIALRRRNL